eukprot:TRINITY_DN15752_c0_g1_i3.p1 TRINITY_DN15752_c0_g1~~TRINITY_DN15752_c0_g1_i3.p1  ORF type:complete len:1500 (-),score=445.28 TRINITY_DN15752_c0_g1_i3:30-4529(-)
MSSDTTTAINSSNKPLGRTSRWGDARKPATTNQSSPSPPPEPEPEPQKSESTQASSDQGGKLSSIFSSPRRTKTNNTSETKRSIKKRELSFTSREKTIDSSSGGPSAPPSGSPSMGSPTALVRELREVQSKGQLGAANNRFTFNELIEKMTSPSTDQEEIFVFLLTYRSICTPTELFQAISARFLGTDQDIIQLRCIIVFRNWVDNHWMDFEKDKESLFPAFSGAAERWKGHSPKMIKSIVGLVERIDKKMRGDISGASQNVIHSHPPPPLAVEPTKQGTLTIMDIDSLEFARQLTLRESEYFRNIQPWECLGQLWTKPKKDQLVPNMMKAIKWFNDIGYWVQWEILTELKIKRRAQKITKFLEICEHLMALQNLNGVLEILGAFDTTQLFRLQKTFCLVPSRYVSIHTRLHELMSTDSNYKNIRQHIATLTPPCVPYIGIYLSNFIKIEEGNEDTIEGKINFKKRHLLAGTIREIQQFQQLPYNFTPIPRIQEYLQNLEFIRDEEQLYQFSNYLEPKPGTVEEPVMPASLKDIIEAREARLKRENDKGKDEEDEDIALEEAGAVTFDQLIQQITSKDTTPELLLDFVLTYQTICSAVQLLNALEARFKDDSSDDIIRLRCINVFRIWIDNNWIDFEKEKAVLVPKFKEFVQYIQAKFSKFSTTMNGLVEKVEKKISGTYEVTTTKFETTPPPSIEPLKSNRRLQLADIDSLEVARQLTLIEHELLRAIPIHELSNWSKFILNNMQNSHSKDDSCINIIKFFDWCEGLKLWVNIELSDQSYSKSRTRTIVKFIDICESLVTLNNSNAAMEILYALHVHNVAHLKKYTSSRSSNPFPKLNALLSMEKGFKSFKNFTNFTAPCVPYLRVYMEELSRIEVGYQNNLKDKINFHKRRLMAAIMKDLKQAQNLIFSLNVHSKIQEFIKTKAKEDDQKVDELFFYDERIEVSQSEDTASSVEWVTFESLISSITSKETTPEMLSEFMLTYRTFCTPQQLFEAIVKRFKETSDDIIKVRCFNVYRLWVDNHWNDFARDKDSLMPLITGFSTWIQNNQKAKFEATTISAIMDKIEKKSTGTWEVTSTLSEAEAPVPIEPTKQKNLSVLDIDSLELARQLTIISSEYLSKVEDLELLGCSADMLVHGSPRAQSNESAPNLEKLVSWKGDICYWVQNEIQTETKIKKRSAILQKFIEVCENLLTINNFDTLFDIVKAIRSPSVKRLKRTLIQLPKPVLQALDKLLQFTSPADHFKNIRKHLQTVTCSLPPLEIYFQDMDHINSKHQELKDGKINNTKRKAVANVLREIKEKINLPKFKLVPRIKEFLVNKQSQLVRSTSALDSFSVYLEPPSRAFLNLDVTEPPALLKEILERKRADPKDPTASSFATISSTISSSLKKPLLKSSKTNVVTPSTPPTDPELELIENETNELLAHINKSTDELLSEVVKRVEAFRQETIKKVEAQKISRIEQLNKRKTEWISIAQHDEEIAKLKAQIIELGAIPVVTGDN